MPMLAELLSLASSIACTLAWPLEWSSSAELGRHHDGHGAHSVIDVADDVRIAVRDANDVEIVGGLKMLEQILAGLGSVAIVNAKRNVLDVEVDGIAENEQLDQRHDENDEQASRIAPDLNHFLARHGHDARPAHAATPFLLVAARRRERYEHVFQARRDLFDAPRSESGGPRAIRESSAP